MTSGENIVTRQILEVVFNSSFSLNVHTSADTSDWVSNFLTSELVVVEPMAMAELALADEMVDEEGTDEEVVSDNVVIIAETSVEDETSYTLSTFTFTKPEGKVFVVINYVVAE